MSDIVEAGWRERGDDKRQGFSYNMTQEKGEK